MKTLSTDTSAAALGIDRKTLDNMLAREGRSLIGAGSRGRSRRISVDALERIAVARRALNGRARREWKVTG